MLDSEREGEVKLLFRSHPVISLSLYQLRHLICCSLYKSSRMCEQIESTETRADIFGNDFLILIEVRRVTQSKGERNAKKL
jgi:hypothetical protein